MNAYEILYILSTDLTEEKRKAIEERLQNSITKKDGTILGFKDKGLQTFARPLQKQSQGYYHQLHFKIAPAGLKQFQEELKVTEDIFRFMIVTLDSVLTKEELAATGA